MPIYLSDLKKETKVWFLFDLSHDEPEKIELHDVPDDAFAIEIRKLSAGEIEELNASEYKLELVGSVDSGDFQQQIRHDVIGARAMLVQKAIVDWRGVYEDESKKKPLPCTAANKKKLAQYLDGFSTFVMAAHKLVTKKIETENEELEKNFES